MKKSYLFLNAAIIAAFLVSGCHNQESGTVQDSSAEISGSETASESASEAGKGNGSGNPIIGSNFISKNTIKI